MNICRLQPGPVVRSQVRGGYNNNANTSHLQM